METIPSLTENALYHVEHHRTLTNHLRKTNHRQTEIALNNHHQFTTTSVHSVLYQGTYSKLLPKMKSFYIRVFCFRTYNITNDSLNFIRLLRVVITPSVTEGVITTRSNRMKFRLQTTVITMRNKIPNDPLVSLCRAPVMQVNYINIILI